MNKNAKSSNVINDVVVVGAAWAEDVATQHGVYVFPFNIKDKVSHIAFYRKGRIEFAFKIKEKLIDVDITTTIPYKNIHSLRRSYFNGAQQSNRRNVFILGERINLKQKSITNDIVSKTGKPFAYVISRRYTTLAKLQSATYTSQLL